jgi:D-glycero-D-manno-heptose 1,7-bisphosphate phosphatase
VKAVVLDRDGVINPEGSPFVLRPDQVRLLNGVGEAIARLNDAGFATLVASNQSCVGRGLISEEQLALVTTAFDEEIARHGGRIDAWYICPHAPDEGCECRKPRPGLLLRAAVEWGFDPARTYFVGDAQRDAEAARAAGMRPALVRTGKAGEGADDGGPHPVFADLPHCVRWLLGSARGPVRGRPVRPRA